ncbi:MAG: C39 family peptidase [bacterium]
MAGNILCHCDYRKTGWTVGISLAAFGLLLFVLMIFWPIEWYWAALTLLGIHILVSIALPVLLKVPFREYKAQYPLPHKEQGKFRNIVVGMAGGAFIAGILGAMTSVLYLLFMDKLFSTLLPVIFLDYYAVTRIVLSTICIIFSGIIAGGFLGRFKPNITPSRGILYGFILLWAYFTWAMAIEGLIVFPSFQANAATGKGLLSSVTPLIIAGFFIGCLWVNFLLYYIISAQRPWKKVHRVLQVMVINIMAAFTISILFGYTSDVFLASGQHFEREGLPQRALWFYELGLEKEATNQITSYLQYRAALLNHKLGNDIKAQRGFRGVVVKNNKNQYLVKKANRFLDNLTKSIEKSRVVLPGIDMNTEHKAAYCVPNSLALVMRYWGADINAKKIGSKITRLGGGTYAVEQAWFAHQMDFNHDFLPMASIEDIKECIDAGFPVMVYVPQHAFVIFGYDETLETFVTYDMSTPSIWEDYLSEDFIKIWKRDSTTLILVYPDEKAQYIPQHIYYRLKKLSPQYLHFQLHYLDKPKESISIPHLYAAAGDTGEFFPPVTILYCTFPGLRGSIEKEYDSEVIINAMKQYFLDDFDEGVHRWGQYHNNSTSERDLALENSIYYLIGHKRLDLVQHIIEEIDREGQISYSMLDVSGMIDLSSGHLEQGLDRLKRAGVYYSSLYGGLAHLQLGDTLNAVRPLTEVLCTRKYLYASGNRIDLNKYGHPELTLAKGILLRMDNYGESREKLEDLWEELSNYVPFDIPIAKVLERIYTERLSEIDKEEEPQRYEKLIEKIKILRQRLDRYSPLNDGGRS